MREEHDPTPEKKKNEAAAQPCTPIIGDALGCDGDSPHRFVALPPPPVSFRLLSLSFIAYS